MAVLSIDGAVMGSGGANTTVAAAASVAAGADGPGAAVAWLLPRSAVAAVDLQREGKIEVPRKPEERRE